MQAIASIGLACAFWFAGLEAAARAWVHYFGDPLDQVQGLLQVDAELGWRQRENFRGSIWGVPVETNELGLRDRPFSPLSSAEILFLGPSSTMGWGVAEPHTYARQFERLLGLSGRAPTVLNAGEIGYSVEQGLRFYLRHLSGLKPRLVVLAYGVNDVDRYRFFSNDFTTDESSLAVLKSNSRIDFSNLLGRARVFHVLGRFAVSIRDKFWGCGLPATTPTVPPLRVPLPEFIAAESRFLDELLKRGSSVILMTSAYHLSSQAPVPGAAARCGGQYRLSRARQGAGDCSAARRAFHEARRLEPYRIAQDVRRYNTALRALAARRKIALLDVDRALAGEHGNLFLDPVHFTKDGHALIARALLDLARSKKLLD